MVIQDRQLARKRQVGQSGGGDTENGDGETQKTEPGWSAEVEVCWSFLFYFKILCLLVLIKESLL